MKGNHVLISLIAARGTTGLRWLRLLVFVQPSFDDLKGYNRDSDCLCGKAYISIFAIDFASLNISKMAGVCDVFVND